MSDKRELKIEATDSTRWIVENQKDFCMGYRVVEELFSGQSEFQKVTVVETAAHGKMLLNDDLVMVTERDEAVYHEMISHVPLFVHPNPRNVLIIGGGDGGTAREVIRHNTVEKCTMVEIDAMVVDACKEFIPQTSSELTNPKVDLKIADGVEFVKQSKEKFDVILVDSTDPIGPAQPLFGKEFYQDIYNCLAEDGIVVSQGESPYYEVQMQKKLTSMVSDLFPVVGQYNFSNLTYPGGLWSFTFSSKKYHPVKDLDLERFKKANLKMYYYNPGIHCASFQLPEFMYRHIGECLKL